MMPILAQWAQINRVTFGFYAPDELREIAVCTITEPRTFDQTNAADDASALCSTAMTPPRRGPTEPKMALICPTCNQTERHCDGHLGVIELPATFLVTIHCCSLPYTNCSK